MMLFNRNKYAVNLKYLLDIILTALDRKQLGKG